MPAFISLRDQRLINYDRRLKDSGPEAENRLSHRRWLVVPRRHNLSALFFAFANDFVLKLRKRDGRLFQ
jgi:hypothetical protein